MKITFLGTSAMIPTKDRDHSSLFIQYKDEGILVDCGEGTQRQLRRAKISPSKITKILISHWHGDHTLGIPGLMQNLGASNYTKTLEIYGPKGTKKYFKNMMSGFSYQLKIKYKLKEVSSGVIYKDKNFRIESILLDHTITTLGYSIIEKEKLKMNLEYLKRFGLTQHPLLGKLQQGKDIVYKGKKIKVKNATTPIKGRKITIIMDTAPCKNAESLANNSDLLIIESTWNDKLKDLVKRRKHLTSKLAAEIGKKAKVKRIILTHFSQRYKNTNELESEARKVFKNTRAAKDLMEIEI